jgi:hypothetical protein
MKTVESQLREYFAFQEDLHPPIGVNEVATRSDSLTVDGVLHVREVAIREPTPGESGRRSWGGWVMAGVAAVVVLVAIGGASLLNQMRTDDAPVTVDPVEQVDSLLDGLPPGAEFGTFDTPNGPVEWVHLTGDGTPLPVDGDVVEWPTGYAILEPLNPFSGDRSTRLWVSPDGLAWHVEPLPIPADASPASPTLVDGVYWLISSNPASIWRSIDGDGWDEYDLDDVIPGAVGLNWQMSHTRPVTIADQTLIHASFGADFPYADYAPNLTEDGRTCGHVRLAQVAPDRFQIVEDFGEGPDCPEQPVLRMIETDTGLQVVDNDTGDELGEILGADLADMAHVTGESMVETLLIMNDGGITSAEVPWLETRVGVSLFRIGDAVHAFIDDNGHVTVWRTDDGRNWVEVGPPSSLDAAGPMNHLHLTQLSGGRLVAWNRNVPNTAWETSDGLNWQTVDLPPLPGAGNRRQTNPVVLDSGWFANAGWKGSRDDGNRWWIKTTDAWLYLEEIGIASVGPGGVAGPTAIGNTTFFPASNGREMWVLRVHPTG